MDDLLKGNFKVKKPPKQSKKDKDKSIEDELKEKILNHIGGSMVYMERNKLTWDGDEDKK